MFFILSLYFLMVVEGSGDFIVLFKIRPSSRLLNSRTSLGDSRGKECPSYPGPVMPRFAIPMLPTAVTSTPGSELATNEQFESNKY